MGFLDHQGESEFPFNKETVFNAMVKAIPTVKGMKIDTADKLQSRIVVKAGVSLMSWGENIPIQLSEISNNLTKVKITSTPKTGVMFGGAFDLGKNRKNIELILSATSRVLSSESTTNKETTQIIDNEKSNIQNSNNLKPEEIMEQNQSKKWYDNKFVVHLLLVIFFPVGLYALWKTDTIAKWWKITATILIGLIVIANFGDGDKTPTNSNVEQVSQESNVDKTEKAKNNGEHSTDKGKTESIRITVSQRNALAKAKTYLRTMSFSYSGLIKQLEFDQFSNADAIYGADNCGADWNEQAAKKAKTYMNTMAFSRGGLIDQLKFDGFTTEQAKHGADAVGL